MLMTIKRGSDAGRNALSISSAPPKMKIPVYFLSVIAGLIASSSWITEAAKDGDSEMERIVGGHDAEEGQFPWAVALYKNGVFTCTASIISPTTVLTAAHCVVSERVTTPASSLHGIAYYNRSAEGPRLEFNLVIPHPKYEESGIENDIAVLKTTQPIPLGLGVQRICIAHRDTGRGEFKSLRAEGWGNTGIIRFLPNYPEILQYVDLDVVGNRECRFYYFGRRLEDYKICAGGRIFRSICNGDSGGPLIYDEGKNGTQPFQVGVASYGNAVTGCTGITPSVWTQISYFFDFIMEASGEDPEICVI